MCMALANLQILDRMIGYYGDENKVGMVVLRVVY